MVETTLYHMRLSSPLGPMLLTASGNRITAIQWRRLGQGECPLNRSNRVLRRCARRLTQYFKGCLTTFDCDVSLQGTRFQNRVWNVLRKIPSGSTISYGDLAKKAGRSGAARAAANAMAANPIPIVIPCHRVIRSSGQMGGYAGGLYRKKWLLRHENVIRGDRVIGDRVKS